MNVVVIFAAGQGTRMKSDLPKVLHTLACKSLLSYVYDVARVFNPAQIILVVSPELGDFIHAHPKSIDFPIEELTLAVQHPAKGTGHAMQVAMASIHPGSQNVLVLCADVPFVTSEMLSPLIHNTSECCFLGMHVTAPHSYGRMVTEGGKLLRIVETKDARGDEQEINYVWSGIMGAKVSFLEKYLPKLSKSSVTGEYYLTELVKLANDADNTDRTTVTHMEALDSSAFKGVNDKAELAAMENRKQECMRRHFLEQGVKMIAPETVFFAHDTVIDEDVTLMPYITFGKGVYLKKGATILSFCHIEDSVIEARASIGPFAHLRGGNHIGEKAAIGNFVEVKKTTMHPKAKAKHLTYLGDTDVGEGANIGAGTITCNYDGKNKSKTTIGSKSFIGANVTLIAPVTIHDGALVAAGSVIIEDVPAGSLALGRAKQVIKEKKGKRRCVELLA